MSEFLEFRIDKFFFKVALDRLYSEEGIWVKYIEGKVWIGLTDFLQGRSGDVAFAEVKPEGTILKIGDEAAIIETIKVDTILSAPVSGTIIQVNPAMEERPEVINLDPYGEGWLAVLQAADWEAEGVHLLNPETYFELMKRLAEEATRQYE